MLRLKSFLCFMLVIGIFFSLCLCVQAEDTRSLEDIIIEACVYGTSADISGFQITRDELEVLFQKLQATGKLPWYTHPTYYFDYDKDTGIVLNFDPDHLAESDFDQTLYEQKVADILDKCVLEGMSNWQIALSIHDYLAANAAYDETLATRTGYHLLVDGHSVCTGYTEAYQDLLNRAGIPCISVTSEPMEHIWNLVNIDGSWYHVDLTWADPTSDTYGQVDHTYFLVTDEEISGGDEPHHDWVTDISCTDTRFSDAFWRGITSQICYTDADTCYFIREKDWDNHIYKRQESADRETVLYTDKCTYINIGHGEYCYSHTGLSLWNGRLYFCSMQEVISMLPDGTDRQTVLRYDTKANKKHLGGCFVKNDTAYLSLRDHDGNPTSSEEALSPSGYHTHSFTQTVTAPTCLETGITRSMCECGLECTSKPTAATGHSYVRTETKEFTLFEDGYTVDTCSGCGDTVTETMPRPAILTLLLSSTLVYAGMSVIGVVIGVVIVLSIRRKKQKVKEEQL